MSPSPRPSLRLLADENIPSALVRSLCETGHDAAAVGPASPDPAVAERARLEKRILLTQDKHFSNILEYPPFKYVGIIRLRIHPPLIEDMISGLGILFAKVPPEEFPAKLFVVEKDRFRVKG